MSENKQPVPVANEQEQLSVEESFQRADDALQERIASLRTQAEEEQKNAPEEAARAIAEKLEAAIAAARKATEKEKKAIAEAARKREADAKKAEVDAALAQKTEAAKAAAQSAIDAVGDDAKAEKKRVLGKMKEEIAAAKRDAAKEKRVIDLTTLSVFEQQKLAENAACVKSGDFTSFDDETERRKENREHELAAFADETSPADPDALLEVRHLKMYFPLKKSMSGKVLQALRAVDDVSFKLKAGETLGIVGESGCGKTTMGRAILKLYQPTGGQIFFEGADIARYKSSQMRPLRTKMQIIFQDPYSSLPPRSTVGGILAEPVRVHNIVPKSETKDYVLSVMEQCGLRDYYFERYPHEFSGGQRQRICIARALSVKPRLVVCDEPVSALDVSIQAQIINLLRRLQQEMGLTYVFISHDLSVVKHISDRIGVMYLGSMVEFGDKKSIFRNPMHPYTQALFSAIPNPNPDVKMERIVLSGDIPSPANPPRGCKFNTRCPKAKEICKHVAPAYREYEAGHFVACHCYPQGDE